MLVPTDIRFIRAAGIILSKVPAMVPADVLIPPRRNVLRWDNDGVTQHMRMSTLPPARIVAALPVEL